MTVVILDTGCANLASVAYAVKRLGYDPIISRDTNTILQADKVFFTPESVRLAPRWKNSKSAN
ncbi:Imidazole glycerol phosphate synthase subunit HisH [Providencia rustigianii]|nr:Imidazole glycerol phosphate synthase subunit HisH [Providencia rustigianii]